MSDESLVDYRPGEEGGTPSPEPPVEKPDYVTRKDLDEWGNQLTEKITRSVQSLTDKQESRVADKLKKWTEALKTQGVVPSDAMVNQKRLELATKEADRAITEDAPPRQVLPEGLTQQKVAEEQARIQARMAELETEFGVKLEDDEIREIDWSFNNKPERIIRSLERMFRDKASTTASAPRVTPNVARVPAPSGASGNRIEQLNQRLVQIQRDDPFKKNKDLTKERDEILKELGRA